MTSKPSSNRSTLIALSSAALALPGFAKAVTPSEKTALGLRVSSYAEDDLEANEVVPGSGGSLERYDIDIMQFRLLAPFAESYSIALDIQNETLSGASPYSTTEGDAGQVLLDMSGASIYENRTDVRANLRHYGDTTALGGSITISDEDDYESFALGVDGEWELNDKHTTLSGGLSFSNDTLSPSSGNFANNVRPISDEETKESVSVFAGITQIVGPATLFNWGGSVTTFSGYLSDPYKTEDQRPSSRLDLTVTAGLRQAYSGLNATFHADYRLYDNDWGVTSHTFDFAWYQRFAQRWEFIPSFRYYTQTAANFYDPICIDSIGGKDQSCDARLSSFGAYSLGAQLAVKFGELRLVGGVQRYIADEDLAIGSTDQAHPGLIEFTTYTFGADYEF